MKMVFFLIQRYFWARSTHPIIRFIALCSMLGITLGVAALISVSGVVEGFHEVFERHVRDVTGDLVIFDRGVGLSQPELFIRHLKGKFPQVEQASPFMILSAVAVAQNRSKGVTVYGIDPQTVDQVLNLKHRTLKASQAVKDLDADENQAGVFVGQILAQDLKIEVGQTLQVLLPLDPETYQLRPRQIQLKVVGLLKFGLAEQDRKALLVSNKTIQILMNVQSVMGVRIKIKPEILGEFGLLPDKILADMKQAYGFPYMVKPWNELHQNIFESLVLEKRTLLILIFIIVVVACFTVASTIMMNILQRTPDIAILSTLGMPQGHLFFVFLGLGFLLVAFGVLGGLVLGCLLLWGVPQLSFIRLPESIYNVSQLPVKWVYFQWLQLIILCFLVSLFAAYFPARSVLRKLPTQVLKNE